MLTRQSRIVIALACAILVALAIWLWTARLPVETRAEGPPEPPDTRLVAGGTGAEAIGHGRSSNSSAAQQTAVPAPLRPGREEPTGGQRPTVESVASLFTTSGPAEHSTPSPATFMRAKFDAEPVDESWSPNVEATEREYFDSQPSAHLVNVSIECHQTICQVLMTAISAENASDAIEQYQKTVYSSPMQSWWATYGLVDMATTIGMGSDGRAIGVSYLTKNRILTQPSIRY
jgi:hypothetical protein